MVTRGFFGRKPTDEVAGRLPPGQYLEKGFPVLSAGPTPQVATTSWRFTLKNGPKPLKSWTWDEFNAAAEDRHSSATSTASPSGRSSTPTGRASRSTTSSRRPGSRAPTDFVLAHSYDGYSTNVPVKDLAGGKAMVATAYEGAPITADHGGPARLLVPHLYFWKSAKWVNGLQFTERDEPGFWELRGYHIYGDPWREQRFTGD